MHFSLLLFPIVVIHNRSLIDSKFDSSFENDFSSKYDSHYDTKFNMKYCDSKFESKYDSKINESKYDSAIENSYDPYSAAEMQMQALLGSNKSGLGSGGLGAAGMGIGSLNSFVENKNQVNISSPILTRSPKSRLTKLNTNLSPAMRRSARQASPSSISDMLSSSPKPDYTQQSRLWRLSPSPPPQRVDRWSPSPQSPTHAWSPTRTSPSRSV